MKTASRFALVAAAGLLLGANLTPAQAADLGGGCCADLEERVAELEATTAHKGNRVVSLQLYGQVNKALLIWDDGIDSDAYVVDSTLASSRIGVAGTAQIKPGLIAGYNVEFELMDARADKAMNGKDGDEGLDFSDLYWSEPYEDTFRLRQNNFYIESERLGRITLGKQSVATDGITEVVLGNSLRNSDSNIGASLVVRDKNGGGHGYLNRTRDQWAWNLSGPKENLRTNQVLRYDSPSILGFIASATWGDNDYADVALRFKQDFSSVRVAAALGYQWDSQHGSIDLYPLGEKANYNSEILSGSASIMHMPTGLYAAIAAGQRDFKEDRLQDDSFWYVQGGIERKWTPYGSTTIFGEYGKYDNFSKREAVPGEHIDSEATRWGFGVNQKVDAAAMDIYANATFWNFDDKTNVEYEDLTTVLIGSRIQF